MKVGKAKYGNGKKIFKIKDGDNVYRILPPIGDLADKGRWSQYYRVEWGYKDSNDINRPFQDVRVVNHQTKMVEVESSAHLRREALKKQKNDIVDLFRAGKATKEQVTEANELVKRYNLDNKHYMNAVNLNDEIGMLKICHTAKQGIDAVFKGLRSQGIDPVSIEKGVFININRVGSGRETVYTVTVYQENVNAVLDGVNQVLKKDKIHEMTEAFIGRLDDEAFELDKLEFPVVTAEDVDRMVKEGIPAIEEVLGKVEKTNTTTETKPAATETTVETTPAAAAVETPAATVEATPAVETTVVTKPAADTTVVTPTTTPAAETPAETTPAETTPAAANTEAAPAAEAPIDPNAMSDEEFLASINAGN